MNRAKDSPFGLAVIALATVLSLAAVGCGGGSDGLAAWEIPGPTMRPGWNCLASGCHFPDKQPIPPDWGAAGTVFPNPTAALDDGLAGVTIRIHDAEDTRVELQSNEVGNFYTPVQLVGPLDVEIEKNGVIRKMPEQAPAGSCNFCHEPTGVAGGRIFL